MEQPACQTQSRFLPNALCAMCDKGVSTISMLEKWHPWQAWPCLTNALHMPVCQVFASDMSGTGITPYSHCMCYRAQNFWFSMTSKGGSTCSVEGAWSPLKLKMQTFYIHPSKNIISRDIQCWNILVTTSQYCLQRTCSWTWCSNHNAVEPNFLCYLEVRWLLFRKGT